jgi:hypothetical protein
MGATTGPIVAAGAVTLGNMLILNRKDWGPPASRVVVGTAIAAAGFRLFEEALPSAATAMAWLALLSVLLVRVDPATPSPLETLQVWYTQPNR